MKQKTFKHIQQQGESDCGVACLKMILQQFGSDASFERLRELSGTSLTGTTMLGLLQAGQKLGLDTEGYEADMPSLKACEDICILHVLINNQLQHYLVCYGFDAEKQAFIIADPGQPAIQYLSESALDQIWQSKNLLLIKPSPALVPVSTKQHNQRLWFWSFIKEDLNLLGVAAVLGVIIAVLGLSTAIFSQKLIDKILPEHDATRLYTGVGLLLVLLLARTAVNYIRQLFLLRQSRDFNIRLIDFFYSSLMNLPKAFFDNRKTGELVARMNDTTRIQQTIARIVGDSAIDVLLVFVAIGAIFSYNVWVGLLSVLWLPVFGFIVYRFHKPILFGQRDVMSAYAMNESNFINTMQGTETIKVTNNQNMFTNITKTLYGFFQKRLYDLSMVGLKYNALSEFISTIFIVAIICGASYFVLVGVLTAGSIMAIIQMVSMLMSSASRLAMTNIQLQEAKVAFDRMNEFTDLESEFDTEIDSLKENVESFEKLEVQDLSFRFAGRKPLLNNVSFEIEKGEMIAILGESGGGKSTILQILQKFQKPESGSIKINDANFNDLSIEQWRNKIAVVPQQVHLFNGTLVENITLGDPSVSEEQLLAFFENYGFNRFFEQFPNGYATLLGENGISISGGQTQLVGLARALWRNPQLLLLDEPTAGLDSDSERFVINLLKSLNSQMAVVILTHRMSLARPCNKIYILQNGRLSANGNHQTLLQSDNLYKRAWLSEAA